MGKSKYLKICSILQLFTSFLLAFCSFLQYTASMLNLKNDIPIKEEIDKAIESRIAQITDLLGEVKELNRKALDSEHTYLTREELAQMFHCDPKKTPRAIPCFRVGKNVLYKQSDIEAFIESRMTKRK